MPSNNQENEFMERPAGLNNPPTTPRRATSRPRGNRAPGQIMEDVQSIITELLGTSRGGQPVGSLGYPTPDEIMEPRFRFKKGVIGVARAWKAKFFKGWRNQDEDVKMESLRQLLLAIDGLYPDLPRLQAVVKGQHSKYYPEIRTIGLANTSIITALHELGHHLFGRSERKACRFSAQLFKRIWPKAFARLEWQGHLLVRPRRNSGE